MTPLVSVIIPAYKAAESLENAVVSALIQMDNPEVIIVDDCSPDETFTVAQRLAHNDERVQVFRMEQNSGASAARNFAIKQARGKWLAVLDADDWFETGRLNKLIAEADAANVEMVADNQYFFDKHVDMVVGTAFPQTGRNNLVDLDVFLKNSNATKRFDYGMLKPVFRTDFIRKNNIMYSATSSMGEDYYMLLSFFVAGGKSIINDTPYYYYVQPFGSVSRKAQQDGRKHYNHEQQKIVNQKFIDFFYGKISDGQMAQLQRRDREIDALICFYELRGALQKKDVKTIFKLLLETNFEFWKMMLDKISNRLRCKFFRGIA